MINLRQGLTQVEHEIFDEAIKLGLHYSGASPAELVNHFFTKWRDVETAVDQERCENVRDDLITLAALLVMGVTDIVSKIDQEEAITIDGLHALPRPDNQCARTDGGRS